jgi:hypothetical protein
MFYVVLNSTNIAAGNRSVRVQWSTAGRVAGWAVTELSGIDTSNVIDKSVVNNGTTGSGIASITCAPLGSTLHSYKAGIGVAFGTVANSQTLSSLTYAGDDMTTTSAGSTGSLALACNIVTFAMNRASTFTCTTQSNNVAFALSGANAVTTSGPTPTSRPHRELLGFNQRRSSSLGLRSPTATSTTTQRSITPAPLRSSRR